MSDVTYSLKLTPNDRYCFRETVHCNFYWLSGFLSKLNGEQFAEEIYFTWTFVNSEQQILEKLSIALLFTRTYLPILPVEKIFLKHILMWFNLGTIFSFTAILVYDCNCDIDLELPFMRKSTWKLWTICTSVDCNGVLITFL